MFLILNNNNRHWLSSQDPSTSLNALQVVTQLTIKLYEFNFIIILTKRLICQGINIRVAPHSSTLAWKIPWMEEPVRLQSMGSLRVGHDWATSLSLFTFRHWRRKWQPTPVFLPGESQGRGSLVGCRLWGRSRMRLKWLSVISEWVQNQDSNPHTEAPETLLPISTECLFDHSMGNHRGYVSCQLLCWVWGQKNE